MSAALHWRAITPPTSRRFLVDGTELSVAFFARHRLAVYEMRCYDDENQADREYIVRDAETVSDDEVRAGKRPLIVGRTKDYDKLMRLVAKHV